MIGRIHLERTMVIRQGTVSDQPVWEFDRTNSHYVGGDRLPKLRLPKSISPLVFFVTCQADSYTSFVRPFSYTAHSLQSFQENQFAVSMPLTLQISLMMIKHSFDYNACLCRFEIQAQHRSVIDYIVCLLCHSYSSVSIPLSDDI